MSAGDSTGGCDPVAATPASGVSEVCSSSVGVISETQLTYPVHKAIIFAFYIEHACNILFGRWN